MRERVRLWAFAALLIISAFVGGYAGIHSWLPPFHQSEAAEGHNGSANSHFQVLPHRTFWERATDDPVAVFTLILTVATIVLAVATVKLWLVTNGLLKHGRDVDRAYVFPSHTISLMIGPNEPLALTIKVTNAGRTLALVQEVRVKFDDSESLRGTPDYDGAESEAFDLVLKVGEGHTGHLFTSEFTGRQFCYGYVRYLDLFREKDRISRFCFLWKPGDEDARWTERAGGDPYNDWS